MYVGVASLEAPNLAPYSEYPLVSTVGTKAGPFSVGPTIAAPIAPIPWGKKLRSFSRVNTPGEIICSAIFIFI